MEGFAIIDVGGLFESHPYVMCGVQGDIFAFGPFDTAELALENVKRLIANDEETGRGMLDVAVFVGVGKLTKLDLLRYGINIVSADVFAERLPWEKE